MQTAWGFQGSPGEVVGALDAEIQHVAKAIDPERLKFWGSPTFDPCPFLDEDNKQKFQRPLDFALPADAEEFRPPRVRVRVSSKDRVALLEKLDEGGRLALVPLRQVRKEFLNGMFAVPKDSERDRMVLDARPPNLLEDNSDPWLGSLGSLCQLNHFFLESNEEARLWCEDLREFYHAFTISEQRVQRNALQLHFRPTEVQHLSCFREAFWKEEKLVPCLATMAMGDCRAVGFGQTAHLGVLLQETSLSLDDFICLRQRPPRRKWLAGLMIDDFLLIEAVRLQEGDQCAREADGKINEVRAAYEKVKLPRHEGKAVSGAAEGAFWGAQLCGKTGILRPNLKRAIPLASLASRLLAVGRTTVSLLEVLAGSFVSVFQLRRRLMSCMDEIYAAQRGRERKQIISISLELHDEILCLLSLLPLSCIDMRLKPSASVIASDASTSLEAAVETKVGEEVVKELQKHTVQKGMWNKLLTPYKAFLREKGLTEELEELPEGEYDMHPAFEEVATACSFRPFGPIRSVKKKRHINVGEVRAALEAERRQGLRNPGSFYIHLQDSQVSLAAITKGRSSSRVINKLLKASVPWHVGNNNRSFGAYVRRKKNPADDPTRRVRVRRPVREPAAWFRDLQAGHFEAFDDMLLAHAADRASLSGLPEESELWKELAVDCQSCKARRSELRKARKTEKKANALEGEILLPQQDGGGHGAKIRISHRRGLSLLSAQLQLRLLSAKLQLRISISLLSAQLQLRRSISLLSAKLQLRISISLLSAKLQLRNSLLRLPLAAKRALSRAPIAVARQSYLRVKSLLAAIGAKSNVAMAAEKHRYLRVRSPPASRRELEAAGETAKKQMYLRVRSPPVEN